MYIQAEVGGDPPLRDPTCSKKAPCIYASTGTDFAEVAAQKAKELQEEMQVELEKIER